MWPCTNALACRRRCSLAILFVLCNNTLPPSHCTTWLVMGRTIEVLQYHPSRSNLKTVSDTVWTPIWNIHAAATQRNRPAAVLWCFSYWESSRLMLLMTRGHGTGFFGTSAIRSSMPTAVSSHWVIQSARHERLPISNDLELCAQMG